jgi:pyruvate/2-oxoglutarate dehydrogenase complex dihydrolipoamide acyltransferase (E2) component
MFGIKIPKLGVTMKSAKLLRWQWQSGESVKEGDSVVIIETDKVTYEVPAPSSGILHPVSQEGEMYEVGEIVGYIAKDREEYEQIFSQYPSPGVGIEPHTRPEKEEIEKATHSPLEKRIKASPVARAIASEHDLDLSLIHGSGPGDRITKKDVLYALEERKTLKPRPIEGVVETREVAEKEIKETIPISGVRKIIFENMFQSLSSSAQLTIHTEAAVESVMALRQRLTRDGQMVSYNAVLVKIVAMALRLHPKINASVERYEIRIWKQIHIGIAMEAKESLIVPVVRNPNTKTIREIDFEIEDLIKKVRENRFTVDDLANGTFTITNLGFAEIDHFTPIIRPPESAILGVGRIVKKPVIKNEAVLPEARISLSLTFDHRIIDGAPAARFLKTVKSMVEDPILMVG